MKLSLVVLNAGKASGQAIPIPTPQFVIGRDPKCNLRPASAMISKEHCALLVKDGKVFLRDFDSTNGTFVNDKPVKGSVALANNDILKVGPLTFKVVIEGAPAVSKPTPPPKPKTATAENDDEAAALLLALEDDGPSPAVETTTDESEVPGGSTIMEMPAVFAQSPAPEEKKPEPVKKPEAKPAAANAQLAAKELLEKLRRGTRR